MTKENWLFAIVGLLIGIVIMFIFHYTKISTHNMMGGNNNLMNHSGMMSSNMQSTMDNMITGLQGKTGDDFDKAFLNEMTLHHQGAIKMANLALQNSKRQEIKDMARAIIDAQTKEIQQISEWQKNWYGQ